MNRRSLPAWWQRFAGYERWRVDGTCGRRRSAEFALFGWWPGMTVPQRLAMYRATVAYFNAKLVKALTTPVFPGAAMAAASGGTYEWPGAVSAAEHYEWKNEALEARVVCAIKEAP